MADFNIKRIRRKLELEIALTGARVGIMNLSQVQNLLDRIFDASEQIRKGQPFNFAAMFGAHGVPVAAQHLAERLTKELTMQLENQFGHMGDRLGKALGIFENMTGAIGKMVGAIGRLSTFVGGVELGFGSAFKYLMQFNQGLLQGANQFAKYGMGITSIESGADKLARQLSLTRKEVLSLQTELERNLNYAGWDQGARILSNIKEMVGPDADAMRDMGGFVTGITQKFPDLEESFGRMSDNDRKMLASQSRLLFLSGQLSLSESKRLRNYALMTNQVTVADLKRKREIEAQLESVKRLQIAFEKIGLIVGQQVAPWMQKLANYFEQGAHAIEAWVPLIAKVGLGLLALSQAARAVQSIRILKDGLGLTGTGGKIGSAIGGAIPKVAGPLAAGAMMFGASRAIDYTSEAITGREAGSRTEYARPASKILTTAAIGGAMYGPYGAVAGAAYGAVDETVTTINYIDKIRKQGLKAETEAITRLNLLAQEYAENARQAKTPEEAKYNTLMEQAAQHRAKARKVEADAPYWSHTLFGISGGREKELAKSRRYYALAAQEEAQARATEFYKTREKRREIAENANTAVKPAAPRLDLLQSVVQGQSTGIYNPNALQQSYARLEEARNKAEVRNVLPSVPKSILEKYKLTDIAASAMPMSVGGREMERIEDAFRQQSKAVEAAKEKRNQYSYGTKDYERADQELKREQDAQDALARQLEERQRATANLDRTERQITGYLAEQESVIESQTKLFEVQSRYVDAIARQMYMTGNIDYSQIFTEAEKAVKALDAALAGQSAKLQYMIAEERRAVTAMTSQINRDEARLARAKAPNARPEDVMPAEEQEQLQADLELARARVQLGKSLITQHTTQIQLMSQQAERAQQVYQVIEKALRSGEAMAGFYQTMSNSLQTLLQLQTQFGNSSGANASTIRQILGTIEKEVSEYEKLLSEVRKQRQAGNDSVELQRKELEYVSRVNQLRSQQLDTMRSIANVNKANVDYASAQADQLQTLVTLQDNLGMGIAASAQARVRAADAIGNVIDQERVNLDQINAMLAQGQSGVEAALRKEMAKAGASQTDIDNAANQIAQDAQNKLISLSTERIRKETQILQLMGKQADMLKAVRDGYISAVAASTAGTGMFAKFILSQDKNLGVLVRHIKDVPLAMRTGGVDIYGQRSVGKRSPPQYGLGGPGAIVNSDLDQRWRWNTWDRQAGIYPSMNAMQNNLVGAATSYLGGMTGYARQGGGQALGFAAQPYGAGAALANNIAYQPNTVGNLGYTYGMPGAGPAQPNVTNPLSGFGDVVQRTSDSQVGVLTRIADILGSHTRLLSSIARTSDITARVLSESKAKAGASFSRPSMPGGGTLNTEDLASQLLGSLPIYHKGGVVGGVGSDVLAILQPGEEVLTKETRQKITRRLKAFRGGGRVERQIKEIETIREVPRYETGGNVTQAPAVLQNIVSMFAAPPQTTQPTPTPAPALDERTKLEAAALQSDYLSRSRTELEKVNGEIQYFDNVPGEKVRRQDRYDSLVRRRDVLMSRYKKNSEMTPEQFWQERSRNVGAAQYQQATLSTPEQLSQKAANKPSGPIGATITDWQQREINEEQRRANIDTAWQQLLSPQKVDNVKIPDPGPHAEREIPRQSRYTPEQRAATLRDLARAGSNVPDDQLPIILREIGASRQEIANMMHRRTAFETLRDSEETLRSRADDAQDYRKRIEAARTRGETASSSIRDLIREKETLESQIQSDAMSAASEAYSGRRDENRAKRSAAARERLAQIEKEMNARELERRDADLDVQRHSSSLKGIYGRAYARVPKTQTGYQTDIPALHRMIARDIEDSRNSGNTARALELEQDQRNGTHRVYERERKPLPQKKVNLDVVPSAYIEEARAAQTRAVEEGLRSHQDTIKNLRPGEHVETAPTVVGGRFKPSEYLQRIGVEQVTNAWSILEDPEDDGFVYIRRDKAEEILSHWRANQTQFRDLIKGWDEDDLGDKPQNILNRANAQAPAYYGLASRTGLQHVVQGDYQTVANNPLQGMAAFGAAGGEAIVDIASGATRLVGANAATEKLEGMKEGVGDLYSQHVGTKIARTAGYATPHIALAVTGGGTASTLKLTGTAAKVVTSLPGAAGFALSRAGEVGRERQQRALELGFSRQEAMDRGNQGARIAAPIAFAAGMTGIGRGGAIVQGAKVGAAQYAADVLTQHATKNLPGERVDYTSGIGSSVLAGVTHTIGQRVSGNKLVSAEDVQPLLRTGRAINQALGDKTVGFKVGTSEGGRLVTKTVPMRQLSPQEVAGRMADRAEAVSHAANQREWIQQMQRSVSPEAKAITGLPTVAAKGSPVYETLAKSGYSGAMSRMPRLAHALSGTNPENAGIAGLVPRATGAVLNTTTKAIESGAGLAARGIKALPSVARATPEALKSATKKVSQFFKRSEVKPATPATAATAATAPPAEPQFSSFDFTHPGHTMTSGAIPQTTVIHAPSATPTAAPAAATAVPAAKLSIWRRPINMPKLPSKVVGLGAMAGLFAGGNSLYQHLKPQVTTPEENPYTRETPKQNTRQYSQGGSTNGTVAMVTPGEVVFSPQQVQIVKQFVPRNEHASVFTSINPQTKQVPYAQVQNPINLRSGVVPGPRMGQPDTVAASIPPGSQVMTEKQANATKRYVDIEKLPKFQKGGWVKGPSGKPDNILARLTPGEYVLTEKQAKRLQRFLKPSTIELPRLATGGKVPAANNRVEVEIIVDPAQAQQDVRPVQHLEPSEYQWLVQNKKIKEGDKKISRDVWDSIVSRRQGADRQRAGASADTTGYNTRLPDVAHLNGPNGAIRVQALVTNARGGFRHRPRNAQEASEAAALFNASNTPLPVPKSSPLRGHGKGSKPAPAQKKPVGGPDLLTSLASLIPSSVKNWASKAFKKVQSLIPKPEPKMPIIAAYNNPRSLSLKAEDEKRLEQQRKQAQQAQAAPAQPQTGAAPAQPQTGSYSRGSLKWGNFEFTWDRGIPAGQPASPGQPQTAQPPTAQPQAQPTPRVSQLANVKPEEARAAMSAIGTALSNFGQNAAAMAGNTTIGRAVIGAAPPSPVRIPNVSGGVNSNLSIQPVITDAFNANVPQFVSNLRDWYISFTTDMRNQFKKYKRRVFADDVSGFEDELRRTSEQLDDRYSDNIQLLNSKVSQTKLPSFAVPENVHMLIAQTRQKWKDEMAIGSTTDTEDIYSASDIANGDALASWVTNRTDAVRKAIDSDKFDSSGYIQSTKDLFAKAKASHGRSYKGDDKTVYDILDKYNPLNRWASWSVEHSGIPEILQKVDDGWKYAGSSYISEMSGVPKEWEQMKKINSQKVEQVTQTEKAIKAQTEARRAEAAKQEQEAQRKLQAEREAAIRQQAAKQEAAEAAIRAEVDKYNQSHNTFMTKEGIDFLKGKGFDGEKYPFGGEIQKGQQVVGFELNNKAKPQLQPLVPKPGSVYAVRTGPNSFSGVIDMTTKTADEDNARQRSYIDNLPEVKEVRWQIQQYRSNASAKGREMFESQWAKQPELIGFRGEGNYPNNFGITLENYEDYSPRNFRATGANSKLALAGQMVADFYKEAYKQEPWFRHRVDQIKGYSYSGMETTGSEEPKQVAKGGGVGIIAHEGEVILNAAQQKPVADILDAFKTFSSMLPNSTSTTDNSSSTTINNDNRSTVGPPIKIEINIDTSDIAKIPQLVQQKLQSVYGSIEELKKGLYTEEGSTTMSLSYNRR